MPASKSTPPRRVWVAIRNSDGWMMNADVSKQVLRLVCSGYDRREWQIVEYIPAPRKRKKVQRGE